MIDTKLVLIEGPPGSGKSTTAQTLAAEITHAGKASKCFLEWSTDHPIPIGDDMHLGEVIASSRARDASMLQQWRQFARARQSQERVTVMESRFWQTSVMLMYVAGHSVAGVLESNQRVIEAISKLNPVLIYFAIDDLSAFVARTIQVRDNQWRRSGLKGGWAQHIYEAFDSQPWLVDRGLTGQPGMLALLEDWARVTEGLYDRVPFPKITIRNPHTDWALAMQQLRSFLGLA